MSDILEIIKSSFTWDIGLVIHLATLGYILGFLFKNQLTLRLLLFFSTSFYIVYYFFYPEEPLWGAIMGSTLIMLSNLIGTTSLLYDRFPFSIDSEHMPMFKSLKGVAPGEFRRLMKAAERHEAKHELTLTEELKYPTHLYYLIDGDGIADKNGQYFNIATESFVGEISFILGGKATATVKIKEGAKYLSWERSVLKELLLKDPNLQQAFEARIARDMAGKLATSQSLLNEQMGDMHLV